MKRLVFAVLSAALLLPVLQSGVWAQPEEPELDAREHPMLTEDFIGLLRDKLQLKEAQLKKTRVLVQEAQKPLQAKQEEVREAMKRTRELQKALRELEMDLREKIRANLTNEQKERFDEMIIRMREHLRPRKPLLGPKGEEEKREFPPERWEEDPSRGRRQQTP